MSGVRVAMAFGGCGPTEAEFQLAHQALHDQLIAVHPVRLGPVKTTAYDGDGAREQLELAGVVEQPNAPGLLEFLRDNPGAWLVVSTVEVPA